MTDKENEITDKEKDTADTAEKPISDSKEELTEAELDQVAGGASVGRVAAVKARTQPELSHFGAVAETRTRTTVGPDVVKKDPHGAV
jgi:hypothetical protein